MNNRPLIDKALKDEIVPFLREMGFKGTYPNFFRERGEHVDLLVFQFNKWGGSFVVEISYTDREGKNIYLDKNAEPEKLRVSDTEDRLRLNPKNDDTDYWFEYGEEELPKERIQSIIAEVKKCLETQAEEWWSKQTA